MLATKPFGTWGPGPPPEPAGWLVAWLDHWQTLIAGTFSAVAVASVALFVWWYEVQHSRRQATQDTRRLARALSLEIETIADRIAGARREFDDCALNHKPFLMPEIARPFPVQAV